jgi:hypothetical protein
MNINYIDYIKIQHKGYNLSCTPFGENYIASIRQHKGMPSGCYPECYNETFILMLDSSFNVVSSNKLDENIEGDNNQRYLSYSKGIEDSRLLTENSLICSSLDTNPAWKPEMCYVEFENYKITRFLPLYIDGQQHTRAEKNWILLKRDGNILYFLYWYNPFQIITVDVLTGKGTVILSYDVPGISLNAHGSYCVYLEKEKKYLVLVRNFEGNHHYKNNTWLLLDEEFYLKGISDDFKFTDRFEFCTSFILKSNILHIFVSVDDCEAYVYKYYLNDILSSITPVNM